MYLVYMKIFLSTIIEVPRTKVAYSTKKGVELPEMHKNGLKIHAPLRRIACKFGKNEYSKCSEMHFARTPSLGGCKPMFQGWATLVLSPSIIMAVLQELFVKSN